MNAVFGVEGSKNLDDTDADDLESEMSFQEIYKYNFRSCSSTRINQNSKVTKKLFGTN